MQVAEKDNTYRSDFDRFVAERNEPAWLASLRKRALVRFDELGFPTTRDEEWKYTSVAPIAETHWNPAEPSPRIEAAEWSGRIPFEGTAGHRIVFIDGRYVSELSSVESLPSGVRVLSLAEALRTDAALVEPYLGRFARFDSQAFAALNTAFFADGAFVHIPRGVIVDEPIYLLFLTSGEAENAAAHPRTLILAEEHSQATLVEAYFGPSRGIYFTNAVTEIAVAENAVLDHYKVQEESAEAFHVATTQIHLARASNFSSHSIGIGGALVRNDINAVFDDEGGECTLNGLYMVDGRRHHDTHTAIDHAKPRCNSHELYKGILSERARGVFNGKIYVREDAQKTDAKQTNQTLLLSEDAVIDTKPQLEIFADDVRCTHGATVGQLDKESLFYLRSRGIGADEARDLLIFAFANDIVERIQVEPVRQQLENVLLNQLPRK